MSIFSKNNLMLGTTYPFFGLVERESSQSRVKTFITFSPRSVLNNKQNLKLLAEDKIILFDEDQINTISEDFLLTNNNFYSENNSSNNDTLEIEKYNSIDSGKENDNLTLEKMFNNKKEFQVVETTLDEDLSHKNNKNKNFNNDNLSQVIINEKNLLKDLSIKTQLSPKVLNIIKQNFVEISGYNILPTFLPVGGPTFVEEILDLEVFQKSTLDKQLLKLSLIMEKLKYLILLLQVEKSIFHQIIFTK